jgi:hypothetical protein
VVADQAAEKRALGLDALAPEVEPYRPVGVLQV